MSVEKRSKSGKKIGYRFLLRFLNQVYQAVVKNAKSNFFSQLISDTVKRTKVVFDTIDPILNPTTSMLSEASLKLFKNISHKKSILEAPLFPLNHVTFNCPVKL